MICFSFSVKAGQTKSLFDILSTLIGTCGDGELNIESRRFVLKSVCLLLERVSDLVDDFYVNQLTLRERLRAIPPDDLKTKNSAHAKGE